MPSHIMVDEDPTAFINNILAHEFLFRSSIISQLTSNIIFMLLAFVLYRLFLEVNEFQAKLLVAFSSGAGSNELCIRDPQLCFSKNRKS